MPKSKKTSKIPKSSDVSYTVEKYEPFTIAARQKSHEELEQDQAISKSWRDGTKRLDDAHLARARGRKIVRKFSWVGPRLFQRLYQLVEPIRPEVLI